MHLEAHTLDEYLKISLVKREISVWWWPFGKWYVTPYSMILHSFRNSEWDKFDNYVKELYPVQHWLRNDVHDFFGYTVARKLKELKYKIKHHIRNPRREMRSIVFPAKYHDLQSIIVDFHIQCIIEYVEREKCFEILDWEWNEEVKKTGAELREAYEYCKTGRALLEKQLKDAWDKVPFDSPKPVSYDDLYGDVDKKEAWLHECDTKLCKWVVDNRDKLWT